MNFRVLSLAFSLFLFLQSHAQVSNSLLWKATAKGKKPVYLYGTIHIRDNTVFNLSDSTVNAMKHSDLVAAEVDLEEAMYDILSNLFTTDTNNLFSKQVNEQDFKKLKESVEESSGLDISNIKADKAWMIDLLKKNAEWEVDENKANETVLDAYILQLARTMGKPVIGIEKLNDYNVIAKKFEEEFKDNLMQKPLQQEFNTTIKDAILSLYKTENIQGLYDAVYPEMNAYDKEWLDERNRNMTHRLDSIAVRSGIFFAVGAAHLAGKNGLIKLLEAKGYTLTPVKCASAVAIKKISLAKPTYNWSVVQHDSALYSFETPKKIIAFPVSVKQMDIKMQVAPDIYSGKYFMVMEIKIPYMITQQNAQAVLKRMSESYRIGNSERISSEVVEAPEFPYLKLLMKKKNAYFTMHVHLLNDRMVFMTVHGNKKSVQSEEAKRFLGSFRYINFVKNNNAPDNNELKYFQDSIMAVKMLMPANSKLSSQVIPSEREGSEVTYYSREGTLEQQTESYAHLVFDMKTEFDAELRNSVTQNVIANMNSKKTFQIKEQKDTIISGCETKLLKMINRSNGNPVYMIIFMRNNRMHQIIAEYSNHNSSNKHFTAILKSIELQPYDVLPKKDHITADSIKMKYDGVPDSTYNFDFTFTGYHPISYHDQNSGLITKLTSYKTSAYLTVENTEKYLYTKLNSVFRVTPDTLYSDALKTEKTGFRKTYYLKDKEDSLSTKKVMLYQTPGKLFVLSTKVSVADAKCTYLNYFYDNFKTLFTTPSTKNFDHLITDLQSKDTAVSKPAFEEINGLIIPEKNFPKLSKALYASYELDKSSAAEFRKPVAHELLSTLIEEKPEGYEKYIEKLYTEDTSTILRKHILKGIRQADSTQLVFLASLISKGLPLNPDSTLLASFRGSYYVKRKEDIFSALTANLHQKDYQTLWLLMFRGQIYFSKDLEKLKEDNKENLFKLMEGPFQENLTRKEFIYKEEIIDILSEYKDDKAIQLIERMKNDEDVSIRLAVVLAQLESDITPDAEIVKGICAVPQYRYILYSRMAKTKKSSLFPLSYKTERALAEGIFCYYLIHENEDYDGIVDPVETEILSVKKSSFGKQKGNLYLIKFRNKSDNKWYAGITGYYKGAVEPNAYKYTTYWPIEEFPQTENPADILNRYEKDLKEGAYY